ncbi:MAG: hypothetical protein ACFB2X_15080 [Rivularia sp. (in: cyanobacteria)]
MQVKVLKMRPKNKQQRPRNLRRFLLLKASSKLAWLGVNAIVIFAPISMTCIGFAGISKGVMSAWTTEQAIEAAAVTAGVAMVGAGMTAGAMGLRVAVMLDEGNKD